ncbi:MAG: aminopeptidase N, partial [Jatrophihabitantaceae bacterium]
MRADLLRVESYEIALDLTDGGGKPSERTFRSTSTVRFTCTRPGESTFVDLIAERLHSVTLNGVDVDVSGYRSRNGITLADLAADNVLVVDAEPAYTNTGEGLHRFVDPLDGQTYLYSQFETADAKRMYACFDQPDLKAIFSLHVIVPQEWLCISNGRRVHT